MKHVVATIKGDCSNNLKVHQAVIESCHKAGLTIINTFKHDFFPQGLSSFALLSESHFSCHTYPEDSLMYVDCFTCNEENEPEMAVSIFAKLLGAEVIALKIINRVSYEMSAPRKKRGPNVITKQVPIKQAPVKVPKPIKKNFIDKNFMLE